MVRRQEQSEFAGQIQKEWWHNEALARIDTLIGGTIEPGSEAAPPASPVAGSWYRVGAGASGDWFGHDGELAANSGAGWRFLAPAIGLRLTERASGIEWVLTPGGWESGLSRVNAIYAGGQQVVGEREAAIAAPAGGAVVDAESRTAIGQILAALRGHGLIDG